MPVMRSLMKNTMKEYGNKKGKKVYYAMENKAGGTPGKLRSAIKGGMFKHKKDSGY